MGERGQCRNVLGELEVKSDLSKAPPALLLCKVCTQVSERVASPKDCCTKQLQHNRRWNGACTGCVSFWECPAPLPICHAPTGTCRCSKSSCWQGFRCFNQFN